MLKHIVMFKMKAFADGKAAKENIAIGKALALELLSQIPTLKKLEAVTNTDGASESNCELALICDFDDVEGLNAYLIHPRHIEYGNFIKAVRESRSCIDYIF